MLFTVAVQQMLWKCANCSAKFTSKCVRERKVVQKKKTGVHVLYATTSIEWDDPAKIGEAHQTATIEFHFVKDYAELDERLAMLATHSELLPEFACKHDYLLVGEEDCVLNCGKEGTPHKKAPSRDASPERVIIAID